MDSRGRRLSRRAIELRAFRKALDHVKIDLRGKHLLEAGCGNGFGLELLAKAFRPARLVGFDPLPAQIERARRRGLDAEISVGDVTAIGEPDAAFDGAFVFGVVHHVVERRATLVELARVLKPGGVLLVERVRRDVRGQDASRTPDAKAAVFDVPDLLAKLSSAGLHVIGALKPLGNAIRSFAAVKR